jgi:hypothetical protein
MTLAAPDMRLLWETADANANELCLVLPEGGATDVPVFVIGDTTLLNKDLGLFNGVTSPTVAVVDGTAAKAIYFYHDGTDGYLKTTSGNLKLDSAGSYIYADDLLRIGAGMYIINNGYCGFGTTIDDTSSGWYVVTTGNPNLNLWLGSALRRSLVIGDGASRGANFDHAAQPNPTLYMHSTQNPEADNRQFVKWYNDGTNTYHTTGIGGHRFGFEAVIANSIMTFTANPTTNLGVVFTVNTGTLTGVTGAPGANQFQFGATLSATLDNLVTAYNNLAGTNVTAHKYGNSVVFEANVAGTTANAYVTTETTDTDGVYSFNAVMTFTGNPTTNLGTVFTVGTGTLTGVTGTPGANQFQLGQILADTLQNLVTAYNALATGITAVWYGSSVQFVGGTSGISIFTETTDTDNVYSFVATTMRGGREFSAVFEMQPTALAIPSTGTATAGTTTYNSSTLSLRSSGWDTDDLIARDASIRMYVVPTSGATIGCTYYWDFYRGGTYISNAMNLTGGGNLQISSLLYAGGASYTLNATNSVAISATATQHTGSSLLDIDGSVNSANVSAIDINMDVGTALSASEMMAGLRIDMDGLAGDAATSIVNGIYLTSTNASGGLTNAIEIAGVWDWGIVLQPQGTATAVLTEYNSNNLSFRASVWETTGGTEDNWSFRWYLDPTTGATSSATLKLDIWKDGVFQLNAFTITNGGSTTIAGTLSLGDTFFYGVDGSGRYGGVQVGVDDGTRYLIGNGDGYGNRNIIFTDYANRAKDHDHETLSANPTLFIHSVLDPDTSNNQYGSLYHDGENFVLTAGLNVGTGTGATTDNNGILIAPQSLTSGGTADFALSITRTLNDAGAAGGSDLFNGILLNVIPTNVTGWDTINLMDLQYNTASVFTIKPAGTTTLVLGATDEFTLNAATTTHTEATGVFIVNGTWGNADVGSAINQKSNIVSGGMTTAGNSIAAYSATITTSAADAAQTGLVAFKAGTITDNGGSQVLTAFGVVSGYDYTLSVMGGAMTMAPITTGAGDGYNTSLYASSAVGAGPNNGGILNLYGGAKAGAGTDGYVKIGQGAITPTLTLDDDMLALVGNFELGGDIRFNDASGTTTIDTASTAGVARAIHFDIPVAAGGGANAALDYQFKVDGTLEAGLLAETNGAGGYQDPVFKIPYMSGDYGAAWATFTPPAPTSLANGSMVVAYNSNAGVLASRLYVYSNGGWVSAALA